MAGKQVPWITRLSAEASRRADLVAGMFGLKRYQFARQAILAAVEAVEAKHRPTVPPPADAGDVPAAVVERAGLIKAIHEAGLRRSALLLQLRADAAESAANDPRTADLLRGVADELGAAAYEYDPESRRWTCRIGDVAQSIVAPGFSPNALSAVTA